MADEAEKKGYIIDTARLSKSLGIPVVLTVATQGKGRKELIEAVRRPTRSPLRISYDPRVEEAASEIAALLPRYPVSGRAVALTLLSGNLNLVDNLLGEGTPDSRAVRDIVGRTQALVLEPLSRIILEARMALVERLIRECVRLREGKGFRSRFAFGLDRFSTHPLGGALLMLGILYAIYEFVGVFAAGTVVDFIQNVIFGEWVLPPIVESLSRFPYPLVRDFLVGPYGQITMGITYSIAIVFPTVTAFYIVFSFLEDTGYLPRLEVMINRLFALIGLNGKAISHRAGLRVRNHGCRVTGYSRRAGADHRKPDPGPRIPCAPQMGLILGMFARIGFLALLCSSSCCRSNYAAGGSPRSSFRANPAFVTELPPKAARMRNVAGKRCIAPMVRAGCHPLVSPWTALLFVADRVGAWTS